MKKTLLSLLILSASIFYVTAQNQPVPNGDFENWRPFSFCPGIDSLEGYITYDEFIFIEKESCPTHLMAKKTTDKYTGTYALELNPYFDGTDYLSSGVYSSLDMFETRIQGVPFNSIPGKLTGYYKFNQGAEDDHLFISVQVSDKNGRSVGDGYLLVSETVSNYTKFEIILDNSNNNTNAPKSLVIIFIIGNTATDTADPSTKLVIDNLQFDYNTTTNTTLYITTSPVNVFAANKTINFSEDVSDVYVVDMIGANKMQETTATKTLNAATLTAGMYIVTYKYNDAYFSKKIILE
jgi:hypothetical protein